MAWKSASLRYSQFRTEVTSHVGYKISRCDDDDDDDDDDDVTLFYYLTADFQLRS
jgi:hypothetical protein